MIRKYATVLLALLITASFAACGSREEKRMKFFNKGQALYEKGDYVKARLEFKNALQIDPDFARASHMLGMAEFHERNFKKAFGALSKAVELDPGLLDAHVQLGKKRQT
jgi:tetratricopeptide (TPR) repeat protein